jgi:hypothetical protein
MFVSNTCIMLLKLKPKFDLLYNFEYLEKIESMLDYIEIHTNLFISYTILRYDTLYIIRF